MPSFNTDHKHIGWGFWLWWVLVTTIVVAAGLAIMGVAYTLVDLPRQVATGTVSSVVGWALFAVVGVPLVGAPLGVLQWLVLRQHIHRAGRWILATSVGWIAFSPLGVLTGLLQWLILRRQVSRASWWLLANIAGWVPGAAAGLLALWVMANVLAGELYCLDPIGAGICPPKPPALAMAALGAAGGTGMGAVTGAITGAVLVWLLRRPTPQW